MVKRAEEPSQDTDPMLIALKDAVEPVADMVDPGDPDRGLFAIGGIMYGHNPEDTDIATYIAVVGNAGVIGSALYAELTEQLQEGQSGLFSIIRAVVRDIEKEIDLDPNEEFGATSDRGTPTYH